MEDPLENIPLVILPGKTNEEATTVMLVSQDASQQRCWQERHIYYLASPHKWGFVRQSLHQTCTP